MDGYVQQFRHPADDIRMRDHVHALGGTGMGGEYHLGPAADTHISMYPRHSLGVGLPVGLFHSTDDLRSGILHPVMARIEQEQVIRAQSRFSLIYR